MGKNNIVNKMINNLFSILLIFFLLLLPLSSCSKPKNLMRVRIGYEAILPDLNFYVAQEKGYFKSEGLTVETVEFKNTNDQMLALLSGDVDMIPNSSMALLLAAEIERPGKYQIFMANGDLGNKLIVAIDSPIKSVDQLSGKKVGTFPGTTMLTYADLSLKSYFDGIPQPEYIGMAPPSLVDALATNQVAAILAAEPIASIALNSGVGRELLDNPFGNVITPFIGGASLLRSDYVESNPSTAAAVVRAMDRAAQYTQNNPSEAVVIFANITNNSVDLMKGTNIGHSWTLKDFDRKAFQDLAEIMYKTGLVSSLVDTSTLYYDVSK
jgi:NitT/TauT family transport system substrate-binding protein